MLTGYLVSLEAKAIFSKEWTGETFFFLYIFWWVELYGPYFSVHICFCTVDQMSSVTWRSLWWQRAVLHSDSDQCSQSKRWSMLVFLPFFSKNYMNAICIEFVSIHHSSINTQLGRHFNTTKVSDAQVERFQVEKTQSLYQRMLFNK